MARTLLNASPIDRGRRYAANRLFRYLKSDTCREAKVSGGLDADLRMLLKLDEYPEYMLWMLPDFDAELLSACRPYIPKGGVCVDAGANVGHWSLVFSRFVGPAGRVYAFEPFPDFYRRLGQNVALNHLGNVETIPCALSDRNGSISFDGAACHLAWANGAAAGPQLQVPCVTLSDFIQQQALARLDFVKMDIEGAELLALRGMEPIFRRGWRPAFCLELHEVLCQGLGYSTVDIKNYLAGWGYTGWILHRGRRLSMDRQATHELSNALFLPAAPA
ncbi:MAG TPA: FkbM family methyltransferase [Patescibacteria group bacterium]|nr:FkbM family methyltransferase [Patescibacteria group bacterium]